MNKHTSNKIKENSNTVRHLIMGQIITTQNLVAIKEVRHAGQSPATRLFIQLCLRNPENHNFTHYCPFVKGIHWWLVVFLHKGPAMWKVFLCHEVTISYVWVGNIMTSSNGNISALLALCAGNSPVTGEFPTQSPVTRSFDIFLDLRLYKLLSKQWWGWWFETPLCSLWRHCNDNKVTYVIRMCSKSPI